jgi:phytol kinase
MLPAWAGIVLVLLALGALMAGARAFQRVRAPHPELVRKLPHLGMGLLSLSLPWLFASPRPVLVLVALAVLGMLGLRVAPPLKAGLGSVIHGVQRPSLGEVYFPLGVGAIFLLSRGDRLLFGIPILILALADAAAALIGIRYGQLRYSTAEGDKSAEGSLAFFTVAFLSTYIPLLLFTGTGRTESLLIALSLALLVMLLEAVSWGGLDNLFIPLGGFVLLKTYLTMDVPHLAACLAVTVILVAFVLFWRRRTTLNDSALLGAALVGYACWALGGWRWMAPYGRPF